MNLKQDLGITIVFITHDIGLAYYVSDRLFIMHEGKIVEQGTPDDGRSSLRASIRDSFLTIYRRCTAAGLRGRKAETRPGLPV